MSLLPDWASAGGKPVVREEGLKVTFTFLHLDFFWPFLLWGYREGEGCVCRVGTVVVLTWFEGDQLTSVLPGPTRCVRLTFNLGALTPYPAEHLPFHSMPTGNVISTLFTRAKYSLFWLSLIPLPALKIQLCLQILSAETPLPLRETFENRTQVTQC